MLLNQKNKMWQVYQKQKFGETVFKEENYFSEKEKEIIDLTSKKVIIEYKSIILLGILVLCFLSRQEWINQIVGKRYGILWVRDIFIGIIAVLAVISFIQDLIRREKALKIMGEFKKSKSIFNSSYIKLYKIVMMFMYLIGGILYWTYESQNIVGGFISYQTYEKWITMANLFLIIYLGGYLLYYSVIQKIIENTAENLAKAIKRGAIDEVKKSVEFEGNAANLLGDSYSIIFKEIRVLIDEAEKAIDRENEALNDRNEVITNAAHDIKTPITSIKNYIYILENRKLSEAKKIEYIDILKDKVRNLDVLLQNLKAVNNISSYSVNLEMINIVSLTNEVLKEHKTDLDEKRITVELDLEDGFNPLIKCDKEHSKTALRNIFSNIEKYTLEKSKVKIKFKIVENKVEIEFINKAKENLEIEGEELLKRFKRADKSRHTEGHGLGLDIVNSLIKIQGGSFRVCVEKNIFKSIIRY